MNWMGDFIERHWGDLIALYIVHLGIVIIWQAHGDSDLAHVGESFILAGVAALRFKGAGNGMTKP